MITSCMTCLFPADCVDTRGGQVVLIFCKHSAWDLDSFTALELAKLILYYQSLPRYVEIRIPALTDFFVSDFTPQTVPPTVTDVIEFLYLVLRSYFVRGNVTKRT